MNSGTIGLISKWRHKSLEKKKGVGRHFPVVLEIGAGQGQHLEHVKHSFDTYYETDIRLEVLEKSASLRIPPRGSKMVQMAMNAEDLSFFSDDSVDRIVITCVLAHLSNPKAALKEFRRILRHGGELCIYLPSEPGVMIRSIRYLTTVQKARFIGFSHLPFVYLEHRNHYLFLKYLMQEIFEHDSHHIRSYPIPGMSWNFSLWKIYIVTRAKI